MTDLRHTALHDLNEALGARMVTFAGYEMPLQYAEGIMHEHRHCREKAGLFDVSHMGQLLVHGVGAAAALEALAPIDVQDLPDGRQRYGLLTDEDGGILDDFMIARDGRQLRMVVNASRKADDLAHLRALMPAGVTVEELTDRALLALQGPRAEAALARLLQGVAAMKFMDAAEFKWRNALLWVTRSGYTGEDGFEISVPADHAVPLAEALLSRDDVAMIGLGARDTLRLEAGLCLYGQDIDTTTSPVEAGLSWSVPRIRRPGGAREGNFPGALRILAELRNGSARKRVGLLPDGRAPWRPGIALFAAAEGAEQVGTVTSGGFGPSLDRPVAMGYLPKALCALGTRIYAEIRGKRVAADIAALPFHPTSYKK